MWCGGTGRLERLGVLWGGTGRLGRSGVVCGGVGGWGGCETGAGLRRQGSGLVSFPGRVLGDSVGEDDRAEGGDDDARDEGGEVHAEERRCPPPPVRGSRDMSCEQEK